MISFSWVSVEFNISSLGKFSIIFNNDFDSKLYGEKPDIFKILDHLKDCPKEKINKNIDELLIDIKKQNFKDSLKGVYSIDDKIFNRVIQNCLSALQKVKEIYNSKKT